MKNLRISGLTGSESEIKVQFLELAGNKLKVQLKPEEITIRKYNNKDNAPVQIIFNSVWTRNSCFREKLKLRGTNTFLSEDLTHEEDHIFYETRKFKRDGTIHSSWTRNNTIYVKTSEFSVPQPVDHDTLKELCSQAQCGSTIAIPRGSSNRSFHDALEHIRSDEQCAGLSDFEGFTSIDIELSQVKSNMIKMKIDELLNSS